jgi:hypothetical protein
MQATRTAAPTTEFQATTTAARAGFLALSAAITFTLLAGVGQVADRQYDDALLAQLAVAPVLASTASAPRA